LEIITRTIKIKITTPDIRTTNQNRITDHKELIYETTILTPKKNTIMMTEITTKKMKGTII
jgi:hypothetical protein